VSLPGPQGDGYPVIVDKYTKNKRKMEVISRTAGPGSLRGIIPSPSALASSKGSFAVNIVDLSHFALYNVCISRAGISSYN
jgi:hypothetical protein